MCKKSTQKFKLSWSRSDRPDEVFVVSRLKDLWSFLMKRGVIDRWVDVYSRNFFAGKITRATELNSPFYWSNELQEAYLRGEFSDLNDFKRCRFSKAFCDFFEPYQDRPTLSYLKEELRPDLPMDCRILSEIRGYSDPYLTYIED